MIALSRVPRAVLAAVGAFVDTLIPPDCADCARTAELVRTALEDVEAEQDCLAPQLCWGTPESSPAASAAAGDIPAGSTRLPESPAGLSHVYPQHQNPK